MTTVERTLNIVLGSASVISPSISSFSSLFDIAFLLRAHEKTAEPAPPRAGHGSKPAFSLDLAAVSTLAGPFSAIATVCSKWAAREPSCVEIDHSSS